MYTSGTWGNAAAALPMVADLDEGTLDRGVPKPYKRRPAHMSAACETTGIETGIDPHVERWMILEPVSAGVLPGLHTLRPSGLALDA